VLVTRLAAPLLRRESLPLVPAEAWDGTALLLPPAIAGAALRDRLDGGGVPASGARLAVGVLLRDLPVALLATG
jgi:(1->4)-alpha-D-glucan 1-alpha-D-glucosylmutase